MDKSVPIAPAQKSGQIPRLDRIRTAGPSIPNKLNTSEHGDFSAANQYVFVIH